ncbi:MAG TPA: hypothetical protein VNH18_25375 [Bryobacteraceae bacterium]|nr:hypothetical protein [Bryobacteraceae bacterium]
MSDFWRAAWPAAAALGGAFCLFWFYKIVLTRPCWRCNTPVIPRKRHGRMLGFLPLVKCDRCGAWRGYIFR